MGIIGANADSSHLPWPFSSRRFLPLSVPSRTAALQLGLSGDTDAVSSDFAFSSLIPFSVQLP